MFGAFGIRAMGLRAHCGRYPLEDVGSGRVKK